MVSATKEDLSWAIKEVKKNGASTKKGTNIDLKATCGIEGPAAAERIVGGHEAEEHQWPWQVALFIYDGWTHPQWNDNTLANDLALIELPSPIDFNDYIAPSCLPMGGDTADEGELVTVTGWGKPSDSAGGISPVLRMVSDLPCISNKECNDFYGIVGDGIVCIDTTGGKGSCNGDSGGPLVMKAGMKAAGQAWNQVGIVSFGSSAGCEVG